MPDMQSIIDTLVGAAAAAENGRAAEIVVKDDWLRQAVIAMRAGAVLSDHASPPAASVYVISGRIRITGQEPNELGSGEMHALDHFRHGVEALADSVFLLTTVTSQQTGSHWEESV